MSAKIDKRVAIVTGSSKGIGRAIAESLASRGDAVVITSRTQSHAEEVASDFVNRGHTAIGLGYDLENKNDIDILIQSALDRYGRIDTLVNNAISHNCLVPINGGEDSSILDAINVNLGHTYLLCCRCYSHLADNRGSIVNIGSIVSRRHLIGLPLYGWIKGSLISMTKVLASEWSSLGVRVNAVNPGFVRTSAFADMGMPPDLIDRSYELYAQMQPLAGVGVPEDISHAVDYLTSAEARFTTGAVLDVDGGYSVKGAELYP